MHVIAIVLCDNDFGNMFVPLLKSVYDIIKYRGESRCTEEYITEIIMEGIGYYYIAYQQYEIKLNKAREEDYLSTVKYLKMKIKVLFDVEALDFISKNDHDSGSWYLTTVNGQVGYF